MLSEMRKARQLSKETYKLIAYIMVQNKFFDIEYVSNVLGRSRTSKYRIKKELERAFARLSVCKDFDFFRKYKELRDKFLAVALEQTKSVAISKK
jgi:hypothetical protein